MKGIRRRMELRGEALFEGLDLPALGYRVTRTTPTELATHVVIGR